MRFGVMIAAAAAMLCAGQAEAEIFSINISAYVTGQRITFGCGPTTSPYCSTPSPFAGTVGTPNFYIDLQPGRNGFQFGSVSSGIFEGTIINTNRVLTGIDLSYYTGACTRGTAPPAGCTDISHAFASTFLVEGGVPEPATWAMMILGLGAAGYMMRRRRAQHYTPVMR